MSSIVFRSPTGSWLPRYQDQCGSGLFGASRKRVKGGKTVRYTHKGLDLYREPGQPVFSPTICEVFRHVQCYENTRHFTGLELDAPWCRIKLLYVTFDPEAMPVGKELGAGDQIGRAQDIRARHPGITPHIHLEFTRIDPSAVWAAMGIIAKAEDLAKALRNI